MKKIGLISAISQETGPILGRLPGAVQTRLGSLPAWYFTICCSAPQQKPAAEDCIAQCVIVESGIGMTNASHATAVILEAFKPDIILSIGFCGALRKGVITGDLVLAEHLFLHTEGSLQRQNVLQLFPESRLLKQPAKFKLHRGTFITTEAIVPKESISHLLGEEMPTPVLEMESFAVFRACSNAGISFAAIRSVSDAAHDDPFLLVKEIIGPDFHIDRKRALLALIKKPGYLPHMLQLARNARIAGKSLADAVTYILKDLSCV